MEFYLGKNKSGQEFVITDQCRMRKEEWHILRDGQAVARFYKYKDYLDRIALHLHYEIEDPPIEYSGAFDTLDEFLELRFEITTTQEFKDYRMALVVMNKITE